MAFFDVRIFNPFARAHINAELQAVFDSNEKQKKAAYNQRVIDIEHGSFTQVVLSAYGGFGRETERFISMLIVKVSEKRDMPVSVIANYIRTKLSFILVRSQTGHLHQRFQETLANMHGHKRSGGGASVQGQSRRGERRRMKRTMINGGKSDEDGERRRS